MVRKRGLDPLFTRPMELGRAVSVDGDGIRALVLVAGVAIKFAIIHEGQMALDTPLPEDEICGIRILTPTDQVASQLLANDDRWADTSTFSRDLIDLAMMKPDSAHCGRVRRRQVMHTARRWARVSTRQSPISGIARNASMSPSERLTWTYPVRLTGRTSAISPHGARSSNSYVRRRSSLGVAYAGRGQCSVSCRKGDRDAVAHVEIRPVGTSTGYVDVRGPA